jgi:methionyl-tRNA synthetase
VHPNELLDIFGTDSYRYYFMRQFTFGNDGDYSVESMLERHNADLANGLGNLASRVLAMLGSNYDGVVPEPAGDRAKDLPAFVDEAAARYDRCMVELELQPALDAAWSLVDRANGYLVEEEPWKLAKQADRAEDLAGVLYAAAELLRLLAVFLSPIIPATAQALWDQLGIGGRVADQRLPEAATWGGLAPGTRTTKGEALFPRLDADRL